MVLHKTTKVKRAAAHGSSTASTTEGGRRGRRTVPSASGGGKSVPESTAADSTDRVLCKSRAAGPVLHNNPTMDTLDTERWIDGLKRRNSILGVSSDLPLLFTLTYYVGTYVLCKSVVERGSLGTVGGWMA